VLGGDPAGGPGILKIESTGDAIDIQYFPCEIESGAHLALHGFEINFGKSHSAAFYKFVFKSILSQDSQLSSHQTMTNLRDVFVGNSGPLIVGIDGNVFQ